MMELARPFLDYEFMQRALLAAVLLSCSASPIGAFLVLRRMSLVGDTMSHAILPGVAFAYMIWGLSTVWMSVGGVISALFIAFIAGYISRRIKLYEDASFASFYLISIALGTTLVSLYGNNVDLLGMLFGTLLGISDYSLYLILAVAIFTLGAVAIFYRGLVIESFDPDFLKLMRAPSHFLHALFLTILVLNLIAAFHALGSLLAVGLLILPAIIAKLWCKTLPKIMLLSCALSLCASFAGLILSFHFNFPAGPAIILVLAAFYITSLLIRLAGDDLKNRRLAIIQS